MLYVLDLDDTLFLERDFVKSGFKAVDDWLFKNTNLKCFFDSAWHLFENGSRGNIFNLVLEQAGCFSQCLIEQLVLIYRHHSPEICLLPDAEEFMEKHKKNSMALITDGYSITQWNKIDKLNLRRYFQKIVVTGDWGKKFWKPHRRSYIEVSMGFRERECIYIGDNPLKDFISPKELKWSPSIRVKRTESLHFNLPTPSHCIQVSSLQEVL